MARDAGATSVTFTSPRAAGALHPHVYGINMPSTDELKAGTAGRSPRSPRNWVRTTWCTRVEDLKAAILEGSDVQDLDMSSSTAGMSPAP
ncbi:MAG: hypothetical protein R2719_13375 [Micropruina sp.]